MLQLDKNHKNFDLGLELLCLLPLPPALAAVTDLRIDLDLTFDQQVTDLVKELKADVCPIKTIKGKPDTYLCIEAHNWATAQIAGINYLDKIEAGTGLNPPVKRSVGRPRKDVIIA